MHHFAISGLIMEWAFRQRIMTMTAGLEAVQKQEVVEVGGLTDVDLLTLTERTLGSTRKATMVSCGTSMPRTTVQNL